MKKVVKYFKYNEDDILEILTEYLAEKEGFRNFNAKAILIGEVQKDLRLICAITNDVDDNSIQIMGEIDYDKIDKEMDFNGTHKSENYLSKERFLELDPKDMF